MLVLVKIYTYNIMSKNPCSLPNSSDKWRYTLWTTLVLFIIFNPYTYKFTQKLLGVFLGQISSSVTGCPTHVGFLLHAIVFTLIVRYMMDFDI